jgi:hypothetical protein
MNIDTLTTTGSLQLPLFATDPTVNVAGRMWFNTSGTGSIKFTVASSSYVILKQFLPSTISSEYA